MGVRRQEHRLGNTSKQMKKYKDKPTRINMCWQIGDEKKCVTLPKEHAYETKDWVEEQGGVVFWTQVLPD
jgi:hypothetical protein